MKIVLSEKSCIKLGQYIKSKRKATGLTQLEASKRIGLKHHQSLSNAERGRCTLTLEQYKKLSKLYKSDIQEVAELLKTEYCSEIERTLGIKKALLKAAA